MGKREETVADARRRTCWENALDQQSSWPNHVASDTPASESGRHVRLGADQIRWDEPETAPDTLWQDALCLRGRFSEHGCGRLSDAELRSWGRQFGIHAERKMGTAMVRVRFAAGRLPASQLRSLARIARAFSHGRLHLTTRQAIQLHEVALEQCPELIGRLAQAGLGTRFTGGPSVRIITTCPMAGICPDEEFDVTPYAVALDQELNQSPEAGKLPGKVKMAISGCVRDCGLAAINDIGLVAVPDPVGQGAPTLRVTVGGGLGTSPQLGSVLVEALPAGDVVAESRAIMAVFTRLTSLRPTPKPRMKVLLRERGVATLAAEVASEREHMQPGRADIASVATLPPTPPEAEAVPVSPRFLRWAGQCATAQKQEGYFAITVFVPQGDLRADQVWVIAGLADRFGNGTVRVTPEQDLLIPWIHERSLSRVHQTLASIGLGDPYAGTLADVVACPGSSLCQNAITASRELAAQLSSAIAPRTRDRDLAGGWLRVSGCPHSCGQPWIGTIGLQGGAATIDGRKVPVYQLMVGGQGPGGVRLARRVIRIPALRVKDAVLHILGLFQEHRDASETLEEFLLRVDTGWLAGELANLAELAVHPGEEEGLFREPGRSLPFGVASAGSHTPGA